ncbi:MULTISPECIES: methyltransferase domain-containing protein [Ralstonia solanacearum species complex]|nr:spermidine synthase [Ralstonia solanacearum]ALF90317.1 Polyamine aminopropyltransferase [Ralstonia solanacearum]KEI33378.1 spermidine synthase [Ralstonia solanacearum]KFX83206.1 spermidine synthase [Ralstonia solanacearum]MDN4063682.1 spermidine synthase [Ralstonia solanacearum]NUU71116.1 methyltransferase domain-containing protein [Ralstonia solanacearum]
MTLLSTAPIQTGTHLASAALQTEAAARTLPVLAPVTIIEKEGYRFMPFVGCEGVTQGALRLSDPDALDLDYIHQQMAWLLFMEPSAESDFHVAQLGMGPGSTTRFCHRHLPAARITAVEVNPDVIAMARSQFALQQDDARLRVLQQDAYDWVMDPAHQGTVDVLQVDCYDHVKQGPVLDTLEFYQACRDTLRYPGVMTVNLFGSDENFLLNIERICKVFDYRVVILPEVTGGNTIVLAFNGPPLQAGWDALQARAQALQASLKLPALSWVHGLRLTSLKPGPHLEV